MTKKDNDENHKRVKEKTLGQPVVVKERKIRKLVMGRKGQQIHVGKRVKGTEEERGIIGRNPCRGRKSFVLFVPR